MSRLVTKTKAELSEDERAAFDNIVTNRKLQPGEQIGGPFDPWVRSPKLAENLVNLGSFLRFGTSVDRRLIELGILVTGRFWQAQYEWYAHEPMARDNGVSEPVIEAIRESRQPEFELNDEEAVYNLATAMHETHQVPNDVYARAVEEVGEQGVIEIIALIGYYTIVSMTLNGFDVQVPEGVTPPLS